MPLSSVFWRVSLLLWMDGSEPLTLIRREPGSGQMVQPTHSLLTGTQVREREEKYMHFLILNFRPTWWCWDPELCEDETNWWQMGWCELWWHGYKSVCLQEKIALVSEVKISKLMDYPKLYTYFLKIVVYVSSIPAFLLILLWMTWRHSTQ